MKDTRVFSDEMDDLTEAYKEVTDEAMKDTKGDKAAEKDYARINSLIKRAKGDEDKMLVLVRNMAKAITKKDKAIRRAEAAEFLLPKSIAKEAGKIFRSAA